MAKLLIVDDELEILERASSYFKRRNIEVLVAAGGLEALELIAKESPDLMFLDYQMPGMTGNEVLRELHKNNCSIKVFMLSAYDDEKIRNEARILGAIDFIHKPFKLDDLEKIVLTQLAL